MIEPLVLLSRDIKEARSKGDGNADLCVLATNRDDQSPGLRTVVLRDVAGRFGLFTNGTSPKWRQIEADNRVSAVVWLPSLKVQYVLDARVEPIPEAVVHAAWRKRPRPAQILDMYYEHTQDQSKVLPDRAAFERGMEGTRNALAADNALDPPTSARGLYLNPEVVERLELDDAHRLHRRSRFRLANQWLEEVMVP